MSTNTTIDENGFQLESFDDKIARFKDEMRAVFGDEIDLTDEAIGGILNSIQAERFQDAELLAQVMQSQFDPDQAEGIFLDFILSLTLSDRLEASPTIANCSCIGKDGTQLFTGDDGARVSMSSGQYEFKIFSDAIIDFTNSIESYFVVSEVQNSTAYTITIDTTDYTYTSDADATEIEILTGLKDLVNAGSQLVTADLSGAELWIYSDDFTNSFSFATVTSNVSIDRCGTLAQFNAINTGPTIASPGSIDTIVTTTSGWKSVTNHLAGTTGRNVETDDEARLRRGNNSQVSQCGTDAGIEKAIYELVDGVSSANVKSNREDTTDADGIPAHRFLCVVAGGLDADIGEAILNSQPAGVLSHGNTDIVVVDNKGENQTIKFSRPVPVYIWCDIIIDVSSEFLSSGTDTIKDNLVALGTELFGIGEDVILQKLYPACTDVQGVLKITQFECADTLTTATPAPGEYNDDNIDISIEQQAQFAILRINIVTV